MHVLIIKISSLGDIIHTLPALNDAANRIPGIRFDWVVEETFLEIPRLHPLVDKIIPVAIRRWRKTPIRTLLSSKWREFKKQLRLRSYDLIIDAQGLVKSAILTRMARGERVGLNKRSLTEKFARFAYQRTVDVDLQAQAVFRMRSIFAQALGYNLPTLMPDYGLDRQSFKRKNLSDENYLFFLHGTTWPSKHWPNSHWKKLAQLAKQNGFSVRITWYNECERLLAEQIARSCDAVKVFPRSSLNDIAMYIANAKMAISIDTGLGHLAAALGVPLIALYGPTNPNRVGMVSQRQRLLIPKTDCLFCDQMRCKRNKDKNSVCLSQLTPKMVWQNIEKMLQQHTHSD